MDRQQIDFLTPADANYDANRLLCTHVNRRAHTPLTCTDAFPCTPRHAEIMPGGQVVASSNGSPPKFAYTSPVGFSCAAEIHGPMASQLPDQPAARASPTPRMIFIDGSNREQFLASRCRSEMTHWHDHIDAIFAGRATDASKRPGTVNSWVASLSRSG
jgi:hypothetical protein